MIFWCWLAFGCAVLPAILFWKNLALYRPAPAFHDARQEVENPSAFVSVLIPARDEEANIAAALAAVLQNRSSEFEVIVLDDHSSDQTAEIVRSWSARDPRVRLENAPPLPDGWCGKEHACHVLAQHARGDLLVFVDADVRISADALARLVRFMEETSCALASGIPRQETGSWMEHLLLPLIHFILLGFLPLARMRAGTDPRFSAGCGQLFVARQADYKAVGGHAKIAQCIHDGLALPRIFREAGKRTELFDATDLAHCRMYHSAAEVWSGLSKNATEAMARAAVIGPFSLLLFGGQILPWMLFFTTRGGNRWLALAAISCSLLVRAFAAKKFAQTRTSVVFHPVAISMLLAIQWQAFLWEKLGRRAVWKGRAC